MTRRRRSVPRKPLGAGAQDRETVPNSLSANLEKNLDWFRHGLAQSSDVVIREFLIPFLELKCALIYVDGMVDNTMVNNFVLRSLMTSSDQIKEKVAGKSGRALLESIKERILTVADLTEAGELEQASLLVMTGDTLFMIDGCDRGIALSTKGFQRRSIEPPHGEPAIRGPQEGFVESLRVNTSLIRRRLRDPDLRFSSMQLGRRSHTDCVVAYIEGIVDPDLLAEVDKRLNTIDVDRVLESGDIEQFIEDSWVSPFPQVQYTERPDKVVACLTEGRVAIILDGTPMVLMVPATFSQFFQATEDYYERWAIGSLTRILRFVASYTATFTPALYVAILAYHPGLLPTRLALAIAAMRLMVPFPVVLEVLIMEVAFELFREAGTRLPQPVGSIIGIVGGLIIGQASVEAGLASPGTIIVVAMAGVASFAMPAYNLSIGFRVLRFPITLAAAILGLYGVALAFIIINIHMVSMKSFGVPYMSPIAPYRYGDWKDTVIRAPIRFLLTRPLITRAHQPVRMKNPKEG